MKKILPLSFLILILIIFALSLFRLGENPVSLYWDELAIGIDSYSISQTGKDIYGNSWLQAIYPSYGDYKAPVSILLTSLFVRYLGLTPFSIRFPSLIFSFLSLIPFYFLIKLIAKDLKIKSKIPIYLCLILLLFSPWHFHFSRISFESFLSFNLLILVILFAYLASKGKAFYFYLTTIFSALTVYTYFSARYLTTAFICLILISNIKIVLKKFWHLLFSIVLFIILQIPLYQSPHYSSSQQYRFSTENALTNHDLINESSQFVEASNFSPFSKIIYHRYLFFFRDLFQNYLSHFSFDFLFLSGDSNLRHHSGWGGQLLLITAIPFCFGIYYLLKNIKQKNCIIALLMLLLAPITASVPYDAPHASRSIYMLLPITLIIYFGIVQINSIFKPKAKNYSWIFLLGLSLINFALYYKNYLTNYPQKSSQAWQLGNSQIAQLVKENPDVDKYIITQDYYKPALAVFFYNPQYIQKLQKFNLDKSKDKYSWTDSFENFNFNNPDLENLPENALFILKPSQQLLKNNPKIHYFSDDQESLYVFQY
jgi:4-amino-4-deoxy-L-arabinose transferase-like glycosyltransferase